MLRVCGWPWMTDALMKCWSVSYSVSLSRSRGLESRVPLPPSSSCLEPLSSDFERYF